MAKEPVKPGVAEAEQYEQPTPTQEENDRAKRRAVGGEDAAPEDGAKTTREAKAGGAATYETRGKKD